MALFRKWIDTSGVDWRYIVGIVVTSREDELFSQIEIEVSPEQYQHMISFIARDAIIARLGGFDPIRSAIDRLASERRFSSTDELVYSALDSLDYWGAREQLFPELNASQREVKIELGDRVEPFLVQLLIDGEKAMEQAILEPAVELVAREQAAVALGLRSGMPYEATNDFVEWARKHEHPLPVSVAAVLTLGAATGHLPGPDEAASIISEWREA